MIRNHFQDLFVHRVGKQGGNNFAVKLLCRFVLRVLRIEFRCRERLDHVRLFRFLNFFQCVLLPLVDLSRNNRNRIIRRNCREFLCLFDDLRRQDCGAYFFK